MRISVLLLAAVAAMGGCTSAKVSSSEASKSSAAVVVNGFSDTLLYSKTWSMVKIESGDKTLAVPAEEPATLVFDQKTSRIHGRCCNSYFGVFSINGNVVAFDKVGATKMLCMGVIGDIENLYHSLLASPQTITVDESTLILTSDKGTITFRATKEAE